jgi:hypothetical protein
VSGPSAGTASIRAESGGVNTTENINQTNKVAPEGTRALYRFVNGDTLSAGIVSHLIGYWFVGGQAPVADGTRVSLRSDSMQVTPSIVITAGGFAETSVLGPKPGAFWLQIATGAYRDSLKVIVK